jgi:hypothetical protein
MPRLDVSNLSDVEFISNVAHLLVIRKMENSDTMLKGLNKILNG